MITQNDSFFIINPRNGILSKQVRGKWLFFGEGEKVAGLIPEIDALVEKGELAGALVSRKTPGHDPFPHKEHVLSIFTTDRKEDIEKTREVMVKKLGLAPALWKSDAQTHLDFKPGGWLQLETFAKEITGQLSDPTMLTSEWRIEQLKECLRQLRTVFSAAKGEQKLEMQLNHLERFIEDTEALLRESAKRHAEKP